MGGQGIGRNKEGSADAPKAGNGSQKSDPVKKKSLSQSKPSYGGPPDYLLNPNRIDPFADPRNVVQDKDGTNHPINYRRHSHGSAQGTSAGGVPGGNQTSYGGLPLGNHNNFRSQQSLVSRPPQTNQRFSSNTFGENSVTNQPALSQDCLHHQQSTPLSQRQVSLSRQDSHTEPALPSKADKSGLLSFSSVHMPAQSRERTLPPQTLHYISPDWRFSTTPGIPAGQGHTQPTSPTMSSSRQSEGLSRASSNGATSNTTPLESETQDMVASSSSGTSTPEENSSGFPTKGGSRLSRASPQWGSSDTTGKLDCPQDIRVNGPGEEYDPFSPPVAPSIPKARYSNVRGECKSNSRKRRRAPSPPDEPPQSAKAQYYAQNPHLKPTPSGLRYSMEQSPNVPRIGRTSEEREEFELARAKRKERDDDEMLEGLRNSKARQRGWNGERESDRQHTIQRYHEKEVAKIQDEVERERDIARARRPPVSVGRVTDQVLREGTEQVCTLFSSYQIFALEIEGDTQDLGKHQVF
jgi:ribosomal protein S25